MGTICFPNYAETFMGNFEKTYIYPSIHSFSNFYCQFIDILFLLNETVVQLQEFIMKLNNYQHTIKFDFKYSKTSIKVLEKKVYKHIEQKKLLTTVYRKATDRMNLLQKSVFFHEN